MYLFFSDSSEVLSFIKDSNYGLSAFQEKAHNKMWNLSTPGISENTQIPISHYRILEKLLLTCQNTIFLHL